MDSTFALAALQSGLTTLLAGGSNERALRVAWNNRHRLGERDRVLLLSYAPAYPGPGAEAEYIAARERAVLVAP